MTYILKVADEHVEVLRKALKALQDIHVGRLDALAAIPTLDEDANAAEFANRLISACPMVTGQAPGRELAIKSKAVANEARIAHDYYQLISAALAEKSPNGLFVSGEVSEEQITRQ
jgi:hypothetical protein